MSTESAKAKFDQPEQLTTNVGGGLDEEDPASYHQ